jgi:hypothetical protein
VDFAASDFDSIIYDAIFDGTLTSDHLRKAQSTEEVVALVRQLKAGQPPAHSQGLYTDKYDTFLEYTDAEEVPVVVHLLEKGAPLSSHSHALIGYINNLGPGSLANGELPKVRS